MLLPINVSVLCPVTFLLGLASILLSKGVTIVLP